MGHPMVTPGGLCAANDLVPLSYKDVDRANAALFPDVRTALLAGKMLQELDTAFLQESRRKPNAVFIPACCPSSSVIITAEVEAKNSFLDR